MIKSGFYVFNQETAYDVRIRDWSSDVVSSVLEKVRYFAASRDLGRLRRDRGQRDLVPTEEEALSYPYTPAELMHVEMNRQRNVVGTPEQVKAQLVELGERYGVSEFVVLTICHDFEAKIRSYEQIGRAHV